MQHPKVSSLFIHMFISGEETKLLQENHSFDNSCRELRWLNDTTDEVLLGQQQVLVELTGRVQAFPERQTARNQKRIISAMENGNTN